MSVELIWAKRLLERLRTEGTSIVLRSSVSDDELRRAVVEGRSFVDEDGSYVVLKKASPMPRKAYEHAVGCLQPGSSCEISGCIVQASDSSGVADMGRAVSWLQKWVYNGDDGPNLNTVLADAFAEVRRETIEACATVAEIPVLRDEPHRIARNIRNLAGIEPEHWPKSSEFTRKEQP